MNALEATGIAHPCVNLFFFCNFHFAVIFYVNADRQTTSFIDYTTEAGIVLGGIERKISHVVQVRAECRAGIS